MDFQKINLKEFVDMPSAVPSIKMHIPKIGICRRPTNIVIEDPFDPSSKCTSYTDIRVSTDLKSDQRGIHMSRIEECMEELKESGLPLKELAISISKLIKLTQNQSVSEISLKSFHERINTSNPSKVPSRELIELITICKIENDDTKLTVGVEVPFINACPCTQRWGMREYYNKLIADGYSHEESEKLVRIAPLQAHTNGGIARLSIENNEIEHSEIYAVLHRSLPIIRELLKGPDEHSVVRYTHEQGQFCEDNVRKLASEVVNTFKDSLPPSTKLNIYIEVNESVHFHNLWAEYDCTLTELVSKLP